MKNVFKIKKTKTKNAVSWEWYIPFTKEEKWIELEIWGSKWLEFSIRELYVPSIEDQKILGETDSRTVFEFGFRIPFRKEL